MRSTPRGVEHRSLLAVLLVAPFLAQVDATIANVATPAIGADLGASGAALELVIGGYLAAFAALLITGARLGQTHGYKRMFLIGLAVFGVASLGCGFASGPAVLVVARVVQGAGAALMFPQALTGIQLHFTGADRIRAIGAFAVALSSGAVLGQIFGGVLTSVDVVGAGWRTIFLVNVPIVLVALVAGLRHLPADAPRAPHRVDVLGVLTLSAAVVLVLAPLTLGGQHGWPVWAWLSLAASTVAAAVFLAVERRVTRSGGAPLVDVRVLAPRPVRAALVNMAASSATYFALLFTVAQYFQHGLGHSPLTSGLTLVPWVAAFGLAGQLMRRAPAPLVARAPVTGTVLLAAGYAALSVTSFAGIHDEAFLLVLLGVGGFGLGIQFSSMLTHLTTAVATEHAADVSGVSSTLQQLSGAVGVAGFGTLYLSGAGSGVADATHAFAQVTTGFTVVAVLAAIAAGVASRPVRTATVPHARA